MALLGVVLLLLDGQALGNTFGSYFYGANTYPTIDATTATLPAPASFASATPTGSPVDLTWAPASPMTGNQQWVEGYDPDTATSPPTTAPSCSGEPAGDYAPIDITSDTATTFDDANEGGQAVDAGDFYCYEVQTAYQPTTTSVALGAALAKGTAYTSITLSSVPVAISAGDSLVLTDGGDTQVVTIATGKSYLVSTAATAVTVTSFTANFAYAKTTTTVADESWTSWTSSGLYNVAQLGFIATSVAIANKTGTGTEYRVDNDDTITVTFNQAISTTAISTTDPICAYPSRTTADNAIVIGDSTSTTCKGSYTDTGIVGRLVATSGTLTNTAAESYKVSYTPSGDQLTITVGALSTGTTYATTSNPAPAWTFIPGASLESKTGSVVACSTNAHAAALCDPASTAGSTF